MKIKLDENLPTRLVGLLTSFGQSVETTLQEGLAGRRDPVIWDAAQQENRFLITQDLDFSDIRQFEPGTHAGVLLVRLREPGADALIERLRSVFENEDVEAWSGCFVVVTDRKVRVRTPR